MKPVRLNCPTFDERLKNEANRLREQAEKLPPGRSRNLLWKKARQTEMVNDLDKWLSSPGLETPK